MAELTDRARRTLQSTLYMALGTADQEGTPWVSPVYFAVHQDTDFYWMSSPDARHSRNLAQRPEVAITIFDSSVPVGAAEAVYVSATAAQVPDDELDAALTIYNGRSPELNPTSRNDVTAPASYRLYRARAVEHSVLVRGSDPEYGTGVDSRRVVQLPTGDD